VGAVLLEYVRNGQGLFQQDLPSVLDHPELAEDSWCVTVSCLVLFENYYKYFLQPIRRYPSIGTIICA
jgi:hypothetical protein